MSNAGDADYFATRAAEERSLSLESKDTPVPAAHAEMAERYEQLAAEFTRRPRLHIVSKHREAGL